MLRRSVDRVELERSAAGVADIMPRAGWDDHRDLRLDAVLDTVDVDRALPFLETEELISILVYLRADLFAGLKGHQHQLNVMPGVEHAAKIVVLDRALFDVVAIALHRAFSLVGSCPQFIRL
jgi:hypothetical protein